MLKGCRWGFIGPVGATKGKGIVGEEGSFNNFIRRSAELVVGGGEVGVVDTGVRESLQGTHVSKQTGMCVCCRITCWQD